MKKPKDIILIKFFDHCTGGDEPMICEVVGRLIRKDRLSLTLSWWNIESNDEKEIEDNSEFVTILISNIIEVWTPTWKKEDGKGVKSIKAKCY